MKKKKKQFSKARNIVPVLAAAVFTVAIILKICIPDSSVEPSDNNIPSDGTLISGEQLPDGVTVAPDETLGGEEEPDTAPSQPENEEPQPPVTDPEPENDDPADTQKPDGSGSSDTQQPDEGGESADVQQPSGSGQDYSDVWSLILVNPTHALPDGYEVELETVQGKYQMDTRAAGKAKEMIAAAKADGITLQVCSAYRSHSKQTTNFNNKLQYYLDQGWDYDKAYAKTATIIAVPGTSEHESGLALDIVTPSYQVLDAGYADTDAAKWLLENAEDYGFILRFPKDKQDITKIIFEPWHYRYVGTEYSSQIMESGLCLEEWLGEVD